MPGAQIDLLNKAQSQTHPKLEWQDESSTQEYKIAKNKKKASLDLP